ncbi:outer membrane beta-barrel protein [Lacibacter luteus]|nr:outer membrane beta-barrel protein [Lacibacter luteus]
MRLITSFLLLLVSLNLIAQTPGGGRPNGGGGQMNMGRFYGKIVDTKTNKPIDGASVQLYQNRMDTATKTRKDVLVTGQLTQANGDFSLEGLNVMGQYRLLITAIGFKTIEQKISFNLKPGGGMEDMMSQVDKDLGNIKLESDVKELGEVVVTGEKPTLQLGIDRKIFNVEKNIVSQGGTGVDVMRNVPTVNVDIDGNITLRNSAPQIFVDGRPTVLTLDQIPADAIQSIELITNPSAKYDASGGQSAIINIVLKKNKRVGYSGSVRAGVDMRGRFNGGADINVRQGKVNFFANIGLNQRRGIGFGETDRKNLGDNVLNTIFTRNRNISEGMFNFGRAGFDFLLDNRNTLTLSANFGGGNFDMFNQDYIRYDSAYTSPKTIWSYRETDGTNKFRNGGGSLSFKHNFPRAGKEFTVDVNYNKSRSENDQQITDSKWFDKDWINLYQKSTQGIAAGGNNSLIVAQADYADPINENIKFEGGVRTQIRYFESFQRNSFNGTVNTALSNEFKYVDYVHAAYGTYSQKIKKADFNYQVGLRIESSKYDGEQVGKTERFQNQFPLALFPSVFMSKSLKGKQDLQLNYSRRINRPSFFQLLPNTDYSDIFNYQTGNPNLKPEFTNSLELTYQKTYGDKNNTVLVTLFGKQTNNLISRYQNKEKLGTSTDSVIISTWVNANKSYAAGMELVFRNTVSKWWEINYNINVYYSKIDGSTILPELKNERTSYTVKLNNSFRLGKGWTMQLSGDYNSRSILPVSSGGGGGRGGRGGMGGFGGGGFGGGSVATTQGYIDDNYFVDMGIRKEFKIKNNTASLSLNWSDILSSRRNNQFSQSQYFEQYSWRRRDPSFVRLNFNYRFGKFDASLFKRKSNKGEGGGDEMQMQ